jgi:hypothetical protein
MGRSALVVISVLAAACGRDEIEVSRTHTNDYKHGELVTAVDKFVKAGRSPDAFAEEPYQLTGTSNPDTITVMVLIYRYAFTVNNDFGLAASMSVLLFVVLGAFSAIYLRLTRSGD